MVEWQRWQNGGRNGGMAAEWRNGGRMAGLSNGGRMAGWSNGGMVEWQEWRDCRMAEWSNGKELLEWWECLPTYYFMVHADDDTDDNTF